ncbi:MAG TPA: C40 family peptidase [Candidatus Krumholzibacteria bacterium]|nr:C40 family peptidase [Candidatus Krumholzibacteria bacterium]
MLDVIHRAIADVLQERGLDQRVCYTRVTVVPPDGTAVDVECSDPRVAAEVQQRVRSVPGAEGVRLVVLPAPGLPDTALVASAVADVRRDPSHRSELVSQAIHGDAVTPLKAEGDWTLVRLDDDYIGWIRDWHLRPWSRQARDAFLTRAGHRVRPNHAVVVTAPAANAMPVAELVVGTPLVCGEVPGRGWVAATLADGREGFVRRADVEKRSRRRPTPAALEATGLRFLGIPYLWGGSTPNGFDCSGLIQRVFRLNGLLLPRDSDMQARLGEERQISGPGDLVPGDLVFFGRSREAITHVGLVLSGGGFLHSYGQVVVNSLDKSDARYSDRLASIWQFTRRPGAPKSPSRRRKPAPGT